MNKYETVFLVKDDSSEEERNKVLDDVKKYLNENGEVIKIEALGLKKLAYEVRKHNDAYYYVIEFESEPDTIRELERRYRMEDVVLKFIVVRKED